MSLTLCLTGYSASVRADAIAGENPVPSKIVMTLGADLTEEQKDFIRSYFGMTDGSVETITITNADEHRELDGLIPMEQIGNRTISCALVRPTTSGGIQAKTANMNYVTGNMIVGTLSTSGVIHCEVLTAAPFEVSGTGALTGVIMAYETASGETLDAEKKDLATEELVVTGSIADSVGQDQATLVVNDIKIQIVRDQVQGQEEVNRVVDDVIAVTEQAADEAAAAQGKPAPAKLGEVEHEKLYNFGYKYSTMGYKYKDVQMTLERVTDNITKATGIDDPITDTFTTIGEDSGLAPDSILLGTDDEVLGEDTIISATNTVAIGDHPAEPVDVFEGDVTITEAGRISAEEFIRGTSILAFKDVNGKYALMDLNGNKLTDSVYSKEFYGRYGFISVQLADGSGAEGVLDSDGAEVIPAVYHTVEILNDKWGIGYTLTPEGASEEDYDFKDYNSGYYLIGSADVYYFPSEKAEPVAALSRDEFLEAGAKGDYIIISDRSGACTLYDMDFVPLGSVESVGNFREYDPDVWLSDALSEATGQDVGSFQGAYARIRDYNSSMEGLVDRYGNLILPVAFEDVYEGRDGYLAGGYAGVSDNGRFGFAVPGGTVTASFDYVPDDVRIMGMSALHKEEDGSYVILSGDGCVADLGTYYEDVSCINESKGMFYIGQKSGYTYDLIDWHGNLLLEDSDGYSLSSNGNYLISEDGYTSSALYMVNDASPVKIAETAGGAEELQTETIEGASLDVYEGEPTLTEVTEVGGSRFAPGTDLIVTEDESTGLCALMDLNGTVLTDYLYDSSFEYSDGYLKAYVEKDDMRLYGAMTINGTEIIPCEYQVLDVLNENWIVGFILNDSGTEADYDFEDYEGGYYLIDQAVIYHVGEEEITSVTLERGQIADIRAGEDYLNIMDRTTGTVTTYDNTFTAVATPNDVYDFSQLLAEDVLNRQLEDMTGYSVYSGHYKDGYIKINDYSSDPSRQGIIDMSGNIIIPPEFDSIEGYDPYDGMHYWANGYFCGEKDGKIVFMKEGGEITCTTDVSEDMFYNYGMAGRYKEEDGTWTLAAADGTITKLGAENLRAVGNGLFWIMGKGSSYELSLIDWHGNVLAEDIGSASISADGQYMIVEKGWQDPCILYAVDSADTELGIAGKKDKEDKAKDAEDETAEAENTESEIEEAAAEETEAEEAAAEAEEPAAETEEAAEEEPSGEEEAAAGSDTRQHPAATLLENAALLAESPEENRDAILALCQSAKLLLEQDHEDAAKMVESVITLLEGNSADSSVLTTLLSAAADKI